MGRFDGKVVVVTGAGSGIGAAAADRFTAEGARVVYADRDADRIDRIAASASVLPVVADVADPRSVSLLVDTTIETFGQVDVVVSNAGIWRGSPFLDITDDEWDEVLGVNLTGTFLVCRGFARAMAAAGAGGSIVVTASTNSFLAEPDSAALQRVQGRRGDAGQVNGGRPGASPYPRKCGRARNHPHQHQCRCPVPARGREPAVCLPARPPVG